jgi:hypothetical protein
LEKCGLLRVDYRDLEVVAKHEGWTALPLFENLDWRIRHQFLQDVLDCFRLEYALHSDEFLGQEALSKNALLIGEKLRAPWSFEESEKLAPNALRLEALSPRVGFTHRGAGLTSSLGKYINPTSAFL